MLTQDVESHFANSLNLARVAKEKAVPATFFVVSQLASEFPELADSLEEAGEIGSHSSDHTVVADRAYVDQRARLSRSQAELRNWAGEQAFGLRPPEERFDEATLRAWTWNGGSYIVGVNEARTGSPEVFDLVEFRHRGFQNFLEIRICSPLVSYSHHGIKHINDREVLDP